MQSAEEAALFIITEEVTSPAYYDKHYQHWDWPLGRSGPTAAVGYDCGYVGTDELRTDWTGIVSDDTITAMLRAVGLKGEAAHAFVQANKMAITISWAQAEQEFREREMPKWERRVRHALPNCDDLSAISFGALNSLAYNRGPSFALTDDRFREMHAILGLMQTKQFADIPAQILAMQRLWPKGGDLWNRRAHEAALFQKGLGQAPIGPAPDDAPDHVPLPDITEYAERLFS